MAEDSDERDTQEHDTLLSLLENEIAPLYYSKPNAWTAIVKQSMNRCIA
ncbi:MAG: hypothetical protein U5K54_21110 [Cytophagales bacterium]|nr:hypothetical protein [Cytophagales bacterium]